MPIVSDLDPAKWVTIIIPAVLKILSFTWQLCINSAHAHASLSLLFKHKFCFYICFCFCFVFFFTLKCHWNPHQGEIWLNLQARLILIRTCLSSLINFVIPPRRTGPIMFITFSELHKQMWWTNWTAYTLSLLLSSLPKRLSNIIYHNDQGNGELVGWID